MLLIDALTASAVSGGINATDSAIARAADVEFGARHDPIHESEALGFGRRRALRAQQELLGLARPELPRLDQHLDADARHAQHRIREPGIVGGDDQVAHARQHHPRGRAHALHRGDRGLAEVADLHELVEVHDLLVAELAFRRVAHARPSPRSPSSSSFRSCPAEKCLPSAARTTTRTVVVGVGEVEGGVELVDQLAVLRIGGFGPVERDAWRSRRRPRSALPRRMSRRLNYRDDSAATGGERSVESTHVMPRVVLRG